MPELPEVNTFQRYFDGTSLDQKINNVIVHDDKIIRNATGSEFIEKMSGRTFTGSYRRGKYLFAAMENGHHLLLHFGMTGDLKYYQEDIERPRHERFAFEFDSGFTLGFDCPRKFARILYLEDLQAYIKEIKLGEDALTIEEKDFTSLFQGKKGSVKGLLLNQANLAGMGNLYADEVCYRTRVHPGSSAGKIPVKKRKAIYDAMQEVLNFAINKNAYYKDYPEDWLWQWREEGQTAPDGKSPIQIEKIAGRTTYYFKGYQKLYR
ncbi:MAG: DNA-(apurinic or apyrimidinic site) lyase [Saprospiraceae bacterium]|nr:DNA-(apurinic or apyrimidinic site) lyase [Saprospiraceae bacterium]